jgi:hypothetical protein
MSVIEINKNPSRRELAVFGLLLALFAGVVGALFYWRSHAPGVARVVWIAGAALVALYFAVPPLRRYIYLGWIYATFPIGFVVSHIILGLVYYGVFTPLGLVMRAFGHDPMQRRMDPAAKSYWVEHDPNTGVERYFRQS